MNNNDLKQKYDDDIKSETFKISELNKIINDQNSKISVYQNEIQKEKNNNNQLEIDYKNKNLEI